MFNESANKIVAIEFDTYSNGWDFWNWSFCHIGIDINQINSTDSNSRPIPSYLFINESMTAQINYNNLTNNLSLYLSRDDNQTINFNISTKVDLKSILPKDVAIGFSATTGKSVEFHRIYSWSFNSTLEAITNIRSNRKQKLSSMIVGALITLALILLLLVGTLLYVTHKKRLAKKNKEIEMVYDESMDYEFEKGRGPKRFLYNELAAATKDFAEYQKLGEGGFGSVYRGVLVNEGTEVAIKKVSKDSKQGKKEYISEVRIISQLRHRNLVQLIGWCHDRGELLLIYELMHNGSLDTHLYHKERVLTWHMRHKIMLGVGVALFYLHEECEQCVVHRDIKPSNIMLDSNFNAKLGDFGLARLIDHDVTAQATLPAGTMGYIAPECVFTGIASTDSDMYSFGIVLLEVACGRPPVLLQKEVHEVRLVEWVWNLYGCGLILDAIDHRLNGNFEAQEAERLLVVGLWCAHPDYSLRPSIRQAISALNSEVPLPTLPPKMPIPMYATHDSSNFRYSSSIGMSSGEIGHASTSYSTASSSNTSAISSGTSSSSWLLKEKKGVPRC